MSDPDSFQREPAHLACILLVDTSGSMLCRAEQLKSGLEDLAATFREAMGESDPPHGVVDICLITFDEVARVVTPFTPATCFEPPPLRFGGCTCLHQALELTMDMLDTRRMEYRTAGVDRYRPWLFLLTDGLPTDPENGVCQRILEYQQNKRVIFFPVSIGDGADWRFLATLQMDHLVLHTAREVFQDSFRWLSDSLIRTARSVPGEQVELPDPGEYQMSVEFPPD